MLVEVEGVFDVGDDVAEGLAGAVSGGEGAAGDEGGGQAFGEVFEEVGCLGAGGGAGAEAVDFVDEDELDAGLAVLRPLVDGRTVDLAALAETAGLALEDIVGLVQELVAGQAATVGSLL
ncbi:hypothetical protein J2S47_006783 [Streptomyces griseoviridis]|uniref:Uncharacterized protein n=1 Tax=Streptomyces griseoviridis TaxID=45398 RepID=A0ABT9LRV6_STRGD|nr:hypothetical protein [Streptomyces griseoviridis]